MTKRDDSYLSDAEIDAELEAFFEAGRAEAPELGDGLMARIMADAEAELAAQPAPLPQRKAPGLWERLRGFTEMIGGWPSVASLATAAVAGVWLGFAAPDQLNTLAGGLLLPNSETTDTTYALEDLVPGYSGFDGLSAEVQG